MEFKVYDGEDEEQDLNDTAEHALDQIEEKQYAAGLIHRGISNILKYGFAFKGKKCLIKKGKYNQ